MDDVRGNFGANENIEQPEDLETPRDAAKSRPAHDGPPPGIGQDERRMQVRAYNHWAGLLGERNFPSIEELRPEDITDFGPNSVLLDFSAGIEDPVVQYLGEKLGEECGAQGIIDKLSDVPARSLLSRITDHYMQILANEAPIGFEAEFVNHDGAAILYRGILLPYSSDDETIDFIYGVINWKEMADQATADELLLEIDQALEAEAEVEEEEAHKHPADPVTAWAPSSLGDFDELSALSAANEDGEADNGEADDDVLELDVDLIDTDDLNAAAANDIDHDAGETEDSVENDNEEAGKTASLLDIRGCDAAFEHELSDEYELPDFGQYKLEDPEEEFEDDDFENGEDEAAYHFASLADFIETPAKKAIDLDAEMNVPQGFDSADYNADGPNADDASETYDNGASSHESEFGDTDDQPVDTQEVNAENTGDLRGLGDDAPLDLDDTLELQTEYTEEDAPALELKSADIAVDAPAAIAAEEIGVPTFGTSQNDHVSGLYDCLASARELAQNAVATEDRSRNALYAAVSRAYDFSLAAKAEPDTYQVLIAESGLSAQDRAPMTPIVKLVFGSEYDKTRLTEYAAVLSHAHRLNLERGSLTEFLNEAEGGLKGVVQQERSLRREESGKTTKPKATPRAALAKKLRNLGAHALTELSADGPEFALVMVRRDGEGNVEMLGEIGDDAALIERAAKKLIG